MTQKIYDALERDWDAFTSHLPHRRYHDPDVTTSPAPEAAMSLETTLEADFEEVRAKVEEFATTKLPAALADTKKLAGNPVVDALLNAVHVPAEALTMAVSVINQLEALYKPDADVPAPVVTADPAMGSQPEPVPAAS